MSRNESIAVADSLALSLAGEQVELFADRALYWPREKTLFIADPHFGKAGTFGRLGFAVPDDTIEELARFSRLLLRTTAGRLVILGDLLHARAGATARLFDLLRGWRQRHEAVEMILGRGNHDQSAGDPPRELNLRTVGAPLILEPFACSHLPEEIPGHHVLAGHVHPSFSLRDKNGRSLRSPCFWGRPTCTILPAFGSFTGTEPVHPEPDDRIFILGPGQIVEVKP
jgi:DNA ligase-associated metallophosphoesterase